MSRISSIRSGARQPLFEGGPSPSPPTAQVDAEVPLPRHLLVTLAGIAADVTALRQRYDEPPLQEPLDRILVRLDGLVDSIYERAAASRARPAGSPTGPAPIGTARHPVAAIVVPALRADHR